MGRSRALPLFGALVLWLSGPASAAGQDVLLGARFGLAVSDFHFSGEATPADESSEVGALLGLVAAFPLTELLRVETGISWVEKAAETELVGFEEPVTADFALDYVQVPLLLRITPLADHSVRPSLSAGPALSFEVACERRVDPSVLASFIGCEDEERSETDVGLLFGAGVAWEVGPVELLLEGQYELGLRDLDPSDRTETRYRGFILAPRLSFAIGGR